MDYQDQFGQRVTGSANDLKVETWTPLDVDVAAATHPGHIRENNEDHYLVIRFGRSLETVDTNLDASLLQRSFSLTGFGIFVADGMGGMAGGEVASSLALAKLVELLIDTPDWILNLQRPQDVATVLKRMSERFVKIDESLRYRADRETSLRGMGTTLTVAASLGSDLIIGHIGDSRAYLLRDDSLKQLTSDHTVAQALIDAGLVKAEDPAARSLRHVLTAALGSLGESVKPQAYRLRLRAGDRLLLCTDGLTDLVEDRTIAAVLGEASSAKRAGHNLVDLALAAGGFDNITAVVARFGQTSRLSSLFQPGQDGRVGA
jgi:protein phosphatase